MTLKKSTKRTQPPAALPHHRIPYKVGFEAEKDSESSGAAAGHKRQEITSTALNVSGDHVIKMCPSDRSPVKTASTRWPSGQGHWNQRVLCTLVTLDHPPSGISIGQAST